VIEQLLISVMLIAPLAGWLLAEGLPHQRNSALLIPTTITGIAALSWMGCSYAGVTETAAQISVGNWMVIPDGNGLAINLAFYADQSRCMLTLAASLILLLRIVRNSCAANDVEATVPLLYPLSIAAIMVTDLVVIASLWGVIDCCVVGIVARETASTTPSRRRLNTTRILSGSAVLLLLASLMAMARYDSSVVSEIVAGAAEDRRIDGTTVASGLSVLIVAAVTIRCAFFPALIWPRSVLESGSRDAGIVVVLAGILPGLSLAAALAPLGAVASEAFLLFGMLGVLTSFTATGVALVQNGIAKVATLLSIGAAGLSAVGVATSSSALSCITIGTLFVQLIGIFVLRRCSELANRGTAFGVAILVAVSGIGGTNRILSLIEFSLAETEKNGSGDSTSHLLVYMWWGIVVSQILWGFAVVKLATIQPPMQALRTISATDSRLGNFVATTAACLALIRCMIPLSNAQPGLPVLLLTFGAATPACLLGAVAAWLLAKSSDVARGKVVDSLDSLTRLSREWFYIEDAIHYGIRLPVRGLALLADVCDRRVLGGRPEEAWEHVPTRIADPFEYLRTQPATYYGLTGTLLVVGLLWALA
tara:strand:- start:73375 stop:75153 length:1779 start_codon:yes stop_codon:yes gene_type:complete